MISAGELRNGVTMEYEGEIYYNQTEYEFELNAQTGEVLEWSEER